MKLITKLLRSWLGTMFLYSASLKLVNYKHSTTSIQKYGILPPRASKFAGIVLPWAELIAGASLLLGWLQPLGSILGLLLGSSFIYASQSVLKQNRDVPCGCTGSADESVGKTTLRRGVAISVGALLVVMTGKRHRERLPIIPLTAGIFFSLLPSVIVMVRKYRLNRRYDREAQYRRGTIEKLAHLLATPPPTSTNQESEHLLV